MLRAVRSVKKDAASCLTVKGEGLSHDFEECLELPKLK